MPSARTVCVIVLLCGFALVPVLATLFDEPFYIDLFVRIMIFAIAAVSLDLILGYGGMVSFGHAAYLGIGSYAVGILAFYGIHNGFLQFVAAALSSAVVAAFIGMISLRTTGVSFIMITLAFTQMIYFLGVSLKQFGGDDGMTIQRTSDFGEHLDLSNTTVLYYFVFAFLLLFLVLGHRLVNSRFGLTLQGIKSNERRMNAIGFSTYRYKLTAFVISGAMCGIAGALLANQALFVSPVIMHWTRSGEIMMMVILGGIASLIGPVLGAAAFLLLEYVIHSFTVHWPAVLGPILVLVVLFAKSGIFGLFSASSRGKPLAAARHE